jgi:PAS domain S-box-containing protein
MKSVEKALRESEGQLRSLMENARGFAIYRLVYENEKPGNVKVVFASPSLDEIIGPADRKKFETWFRNIHPDDRKRKEIKKILSFKTFEFDEILYTFHPEKKEWCWIRITSHGIPDRGEKRTYVNGIIRDVTEKKRAQEALEQTNELLELRVKRRTLQLSKTNLRLIKEIEDRKQVQKALALSEKKLRLLSNQLINAQENERKRVARELHDELGQSLVGWKFQLSKWPNRLDETQQELKREIVQALKGVDMMTENVRRLSRSLRPAVLEHLGLWDALNWLIDEGARQYGIKIQNDLKEPQIPLSVEQELIIFRIFQEALTNIGKHAQAKRVSIQVREEKGKAVFTIEDDGRGFSLKETLCSTSANKGLGLRSMDERARMAGGTLNIHSRRDNWTKINLIVPFMKSRKRKDRA